MEALVRRVDEDRWLASRFAPPELRARLIAIYALNYEIAHVREVVREPTLIEIRLRWWRDAIEDIHAGRGVREHPALAAYATFARGLSPLPWIEMIEARSETGVFSSLAAAETYFERTAGTVMRHALQACGARSNVAPELLRSAALAWGYQGFLRASHLRASLPGGDDEIFARAHAACGGARAQSRGLSSELFPAFGYVALAPGYLRAIERGRGERPLLMRQLVLIAASASGRV